jgi:uncharacterized protein (DUF302 family)
VQATLRDKLGEEREEYLILGACNPPLAHQALAADRGIGLLLPCNVVVAETGQTVIEAADPAAKFGLTGQPSIQQVADDAAARLRAALDSLPGNGEAGPSQSLRSPPP